MNVKEALKIIEYYQNAHQNYSFTIGSRGLENTKSGDENIFTWNHAILKPSSVLVDGYPSIESIMKEIASTILHSANNRSLDPSAISDRDRRVLANFIQKSYKKKYPKHTIVVEYANSSDVEMNDHLILFRTRGCVVGENIGNSRNDWVSHDLFKRAENWEFWRFTPPQMRGVEHPPGDILTFALTGVIETSLVVDEDDDEPIYVNMSLTDATMMNASISKLIFVESTHILSFEPIPKEK